MELKQGGWEEEWEEAWNGLKWKIGTPLPSGICEAEAAANEARWSMGLRGLRGGTGGGTRFDEPTGRSQRTAGMFNVSGCSEEDKRPPVGFEPGTVVGLSTNVGPTVAVDTTDSVTSVVSQPESSLVVLL